MSRILVAFYSRTGHTRRIANDLAGRLMADVLPIEDVRPRRGLAGYFRSAFEAMRGTLPEIVPLAANPDRYHLVVLGTPVWAGHVSSPMRRFLRDHASSLRRVAFFCTQGGRGAEQVFREMAALTGREPEATCALNDNAISANEFAPVLEDFVTRIRCGSDRSQTAAGGIHAGV